MQQPIQKYLFLRDLQLFNPRVYFKLLIDHTEEVLPSIYTPTVGEACQNYHELQMMTQVRLLSGICHAWLVFSQHGYVPLSGIDCIDLLVVLTARRDHLAVPVMHCLLSADGSRQQ
jgi:hypothetical protein